MITLTKKERAILLVLFKDFTAFYNANSISKILGMSRIGAMKILKKLSAQEILANKTIGKSIIYKLRLEGDYARKLIAFVLADEAYNFKRWKEEFKELSGKNRVIMIYGSAIKNYEKANDIDIMAIIEKSGYKEVSKIIEEKQKIIPKKIHLIELTASDFLNNIKQRKNAIVDIAKSAVILYGQDKYAELINNVTGF